MRAALDDPLMQGFVERLDSLNALADASDGFVWRYEGEDDAAPEFRLFDDELILFNMSVWESVEALENYVYHSQHSDALRQRSDWFERARRASLVLWWIPAGHRPTVEEARQRFGRLWEHGASEQAFTFSTRFPGPGR